MRLIDADALEEKIDNIWDGRPLSTLGARILAMIDRTPTIDIVRCKDCKYRTELFDTRWHPCTSVPTNADWFCADGERKER